MTVVELIECLSNCDHRDVVCFPGPEPADTPLEGDPLISSHWSRFKNESGNEVFGKFIVIKAVR